jgi:GNAT superfamily N-acetyltransferase
LALELVPAKPEHVDEMGRKCYEAFKDIHDRHGFPPDFPSVAFARMVMGGLVQREDCYVVAAMENLQPAGSNGLLIPDEVGGVGPVSVEVPAQGRGIGRALMRDVLAHAERSGIEMVRLMQDSFNMGSLSLYASLGFDTKEPVAMMQPAPQPCPDGSVRPVMESDLPAIEELSRRIYKVNRRNEVASLMHPPFRPLLRERHGHVSGYFVLGMPGHGVAESEEDLLMLVGEAATGVPAEFARCFCPLAEGELYRKLLVAGGRAIKVMNLMTLGPYEPPDGVWMPSVGF